MAIEQLSLRALSRATLERQLLLRRSDMPVLGAIEHLVGLQAQLPLNPYVAIWSRLARFDPSELGTMLTGRAVVRLVLLRGTLHLVSSDDALAIRPLAQPVLTRELETHRDVAPGLVGVDLEPVLAFARELFAEAPRTGPQLRAALAARFPDLVPTALAYACRNHLALVQLPPRGVWGKSAGITTTTLETWVGRPLSTAPSIDVLALRYLAAFGPASVADFAAFTRLTGLREVFDRIERQLLRIHDDRGRELYDLPHAPRPDADTPAPPRLLPEYDNVLLSHADRRRFLSDGERAQLSTASTVRGTVLLDGRVGATWSTETDRTTQTCVLTVRHLVKLRARERAATERECVRFLTFHEAAGLRHEVRFVQIS